MLKVKRFLGFTGFLFFLNFSFSAFGQELDPDLAIDSIFGKNWGLFDIASVIDIPRPDILPAPAPPAPASAISPLASISSCYFGTSNDDTGNGDYYWDEETDFMCYSTPVLYNNSFYYSPWVITLALQGDPYDWDQPLQAMNASGGYGVDYMDIARWFTLVNDTVTHKISGIGNYTEKQVCLLFGNFVNVFFDVGYRSFDLYYLMDKTGTSLIDYPSSSDYRYGYYGSFPNATYRNFTDILYSEFAPPFCTYNILIRSGTISDYYVTVASD